MPKNREFVSSEKLEAAPAPEGAVQSGMDMTFLLPDYYESWKGFVQGRLDSGLPVTEPNHTKALELVEERQRERQGPPNRTLGKSRDEFKFRTKEYYLSLQEWAQKVKERKKAAGERKEGEEKVRKRKRRKAKGQPKIVAIRIIEEKNVEVGQSEPPRIIKLVDERDRIENLRYGALPAGFRSNREPRR